MQDTYDPQAVEAAAQQFWSTTRAFEVTEDAAREKFYCLSMLPYPSGALHMGHVRNYTIGDVISRYQRMQGKNVLQPMGWDAFGLPAENAAIKNKTAPAQWTWANIEHMREQFRRMGFAYDWSREFAACKSDYYVHEQRMFVRLLRKGLAYRKNALVNWDPVDQTVLANEQVIDGRGWRTGASVEKREIPQWFLKITDYAQELLDGLDHLPGWPDAVKTMQRNWIGRSEGLDIHFDVEGSDQTLSVFTTRPDTLMGVTYLAVAAGHPLAVQAAHDHAELADFIDSCRRGGASEAELETQEKRGMALGINAVHPISGEKLPIWVANFVLMGYGTGAVMAVPAHDARDNAFARSYDLPMQMVVVDDGVLDAAREIQRDLDDGSGADPMHLALHGGDTDAYAQNAAVRTIQAFEEHIREVEAFTDHGTLVNSGRFNGMDFAEAFDAIAETLQADGRGTRRVNWRLRDWGVSRQRYWGCPIPVIYCETCGAVPVPEDQLPVRLPEDVQFTGVASPLKADPEWRKTTCPECGGAAERETDTFDTFMESSWYYARYTSPGAATQVDERANYWLPVDQYIGGIEHAIMHLLYFRFYHKLMRDAGLVASDEPATRLLCQGMVIAETFYREDGDGAKTWINPADVDVQHDERGRVTGAVLKSDGKPVEIGAIEKMSKSKNNGVDPQAMVDRFGADTVRLFSMFAAPPEQSLEWSEAGVEGMSRFLRRFCQKICAAAGRTDYLPPQSGGNGPQDQRGQSPRTHTPPTTPDTSPPQSGGNGPQDQRGQSLSTHTPATAPDASPPQSGGNGPQGQRGQSARNETPASTPETLPPQSGGSGPKGRRGQTASPIDPDTLTPEQKTLRRHLHETIQKVSDDYQRRLSFNTAIAALMELLNHVSRFDDTSDAGRAVRHEALETMVLLLNPITPHTSHALWQVLGHEETLIEDQPWPLVDRQALHKDSMTMAVQVNGKLRGTLDVPVSASRDEIGEMARALPTVQAFIAGKTVRKLIVVPGKIVNVVVA